MTQVERTQGRRVFGKWVVTEDGSMDYDNRYYIESARLHEDWIPHLFEKGWIIWNDFIPAYVLACELAKVGMVKICYL